MKSTSVGEHDAFWNLQVRFSFMWRWYFGQDSKCTCIPRNDKSCSTCWLCKVVTDVLKNQAQCPMLGAFWSCPAAVAATSMESTASRHNIGNVHLFKPVQNPGSQVSNPQYPVDLVWHFTYPGEKMGNKCIVCSPGNRYSTTHFTKTGTNDALLISSVSKT